MTKNMSISTLVILVVLTMLLIACGVTFRDISVDNPVLSSNEGITSSYLKESKPPCVFSHEEANPCPVDVPPNVESLSVLSSFPLWPRSDNIRTFEQILLRDYSIVSPHLVVRGIAKPNSSRCDLYPIQKANFLMEILERDYSGAYGYLKTHYHYHCFVDIEVNEYIVGKGPSVLTVSMLREVLTRIDPKTWDVKQSVRLQNPRLRTATAYEGREMILFLTTPSTIAVESWRAKGLFTVWFLQNTENGIRAVAQDIRYARTDEQRNKLNRPLSDIVKEIKEANKIRMEITNGRIGKDTSLPLLVTDANYLRNYYMELGAVYNTGENDTVLPPPVPGEGDPPAPTIPTNDGTTGTTVPAPGEEPTIAPLYLEEMIPPCVPTETEPDPCPPELPAPLLESNHQSSSLLMLEIPTFDERLIWDPGDDGVIQVHIVVRGTVKRGTTRCDMYRAKVPDYMVKEFKVTRIVDQYIVDYYHYSCFANINVKEYIVGGGPPTLTILIDLVALDESDLDSERKISDVLEYYGNPETTATAYEGREIIFFLGPAPSIEVEAWAGIGGGSMWFLQQTEDGIRAIAENYTRAITDEQRQKLDLPLDEMIEDIKQAALNRAAITGGRIGTDPNLPMYITDANKLRDYYISVGAVYDDSDRATRLPPPVPGGGGADSSAGSTG